MSDEKKTEQAPNPPAPPAAEKPAEQAPKPPVKYQDDAAKAGVKAKEKTRAAKKAETHAEVDALTKDADGKLKRGCFVMPGIAITLRGGGMAKAGDQITAKMLGGGAQALEALVKAEKLDDRR